MTKDTATNNLLILKNQRDTLDPASSIFLDTTSQITQLERFIEELTKLEMWEQAQYKILNAQAYSFTTSSGSRTVTYMDAKEISRQIAALRFRVSQYDPDNSSRSKVRASGFSFNHYVL
ncbi:MAG TPA: hypothetical protein DCM38_07225 [Gammaproteobacteria bacterium]|nr:hypothetical protein [Gammaproteobacteria bacterium]